MIGEKVLNFQGKHVDLASLQSKIEDYLKSDGFTVQASAPSDHGTVLQAKKGKFLSHVIDADRALTITLSGSRQLRGPHPVSYTHLDVYKRQPQRYVQN